MTSDLVVGSGRTLYLIDPDNKSSNIFPTEPDHSYGVAWSKNYIYAASQQALCIYDKKLQPIRKILVSPFEGNDTRLLGVKLTSTEEPICRPHEILLFDNKVYFTDSGHNRIGLYDLVADSVDFFTIPIHPNNPKKYSWPNSLNVIDDKIHVVCHNFASSDVLVFDSHLQMISIYENIGYKSHNVWEMDGEIFSCSSAEGCIRSLSGEILVVTGGFPRGVALDERYLYIGISRVLTGGTWFCDPPKTLTGILADNVNGVLILDRKTLKKIKFIETVSPTFSLRLNNNKDLALCLDGDQGKLDLELSS